MAECASTLAQPRVSSWGVGECMTLSRGNASMRSACLQCVSTKQGLEWDCHQCLKRASPQTCFSCLRALPAGGSTWPCWGAK
jgi:hypothetical protein